MDPSSPHTPGRRDVQLQGPRPSPLRVSKESHKIKKPPQPPQLQPVVIYAVSPKVIHADTSNFMSIVQRLTGMTSAENSGAVSPAARVAAIEKASVSPRKNGSDMVNCGELDGGDGVEVSRAPGVLSPAPGSLLPIPQCCFSPPVSDPFVHDVINSPWFGCSFTPSPSALLSSSIVSPTNSYDFFSQFWDS